MVELREEVALSTITGQVELEDQVAERAELTLTALQSCSRFLFQFISIAQRVERPVNGEQDNG